MERLDTPTEMEDLPEINESCIGCLSVKRQAELTAESHERLFAELDRMRPRGGGVPAVEGMTPFESMVAAGGIITPEQEFGGRERPNWIRDEIEAGARQRAEEKREAEAAAKERLARQMKDRLR